MKIEQGEGLSQTVCMDCVYRRNQMLVRVAVIGNGIGQVQRLSYLRDIQMKIEQGSSLVATICMDCVTCLCHMPHLVPKRWGVVLYSCLLLSGMAFQTHIQDIHPILILPIIERQLPGAFRSYSRCYY